jgi:hypothetical protein
MERVMSNFKDFMVFVWILVFGAILAGCGQGQTGNQGIPGVPGASGPIGATGPAGSNGTQITVVQFCPNSVPNYPSTFPEVAECINNQLYAVYSANDGFLTLVPPGVYSSDGINSSCTFTILPNCIVQN